MSQNTRHRDESRCFRRDYDLGIFYVYSHLNRININTCSVSVGHCHFFPVTSLRSSKPLTSGSFNRGVFIFNRTSEVVEKKHHAVSQGFPGPWGRDSDGCPKRHNPHQQHHSAARQATCSCYPRPHPSHQWIETWCSARKAWVYQWNCSRGRQVLHNLVSRPHGCCCQGQNVHCHRAYLAHHHELPLHLHEGKKWPFVFQSTG